MEEEILTNIILDFGSRYTKVGIEGEEVHTFKTLVGRPRFTVCGMVGVGSKMIYVGDEADSKKSFLKNRQVVERGLLNYSTNKLNCEDIEQLIHHSIYNELRIAPEECRALIIETPMNSKYNREKLTQTLFEQFNLYSIQFITNAVASLYSLEKTTGIVLESGHGVTFTVPIFEGNIIHHAVNRLDLGGGDINEYLIKLLNERGYRFTYIKPPNYEGQQPIILPTMNCDSIITDIKEKYSKVALDFDQSLKEHLKLFENNINLQYEIPNDGGEYAFIGDEKTNIINIGNELFKCTEPLFQPLILDIESKGIHELLFDSILKCDVSIRNQLFSNILLSGGNTLINGLKERLLKELILLSPPSTNINFLSPPPTITNNNLSFYGASLFTLNSNFILNSIPNEQYNQEVLK